MNLRKLRKKFIPSFLRSKKEEEMIASGTDHSLYEFSIEACEGDIDVDKINHIILTNPWCMLNKPSISLKTEGNSVIISFHVLSEEKGKEIENLILNNL